MTCLKEFSNVSGSELPQRGDKLFSKPVGATGVAWVKFTWSPACTYLGAIAASPLLITVLLLRYFHWPHAALAKMNLIFSVRSISKTVGYGMFPQSVSCGRALYLLETIKSLANHHRSEPAALKRPYLTARVEALILTRLKYLRKDMLSVPTQAHDHAPTNHRFRTPADHRSIAFRHPSTLASCASSGTFRASQIV